jgi:hypothetical protein
MMPYYSQSYNLVLIGLVLALHLAAGFHSTLVVPAAVFIVRAGLKVSITLTF